MKKLLFASLMIGMIAVSCSKDDDNPVNPGTDSYMNMTAGNAWNYDSIDNYQSPPDTTNYTITSTPNDTTINGKLYHIFTRSTLGKEYHNISGNDYFQVVTFPAPLGTVELLYLKDNSVVGSSWTAGSGTIAMGPISVTVTLTSTIQEKGITRVVNGITYNNVIHVSTAVGTSPTVPLTSDIHSYYAPKYGLIENTTLIEVTAASFVLNTKSILKSASF